MDAEEETADVPVYMDPSADQLRPTVSDSDSNTR